MEKTNCSNKAITKTLKINKPKLIFWFDAPPRVDAGVYRMVADSWGSKVYYMCANQIRDDRKRFGWIDCDHGLAEVIILSEKDSMDDFIKNFIEENSDAIHILNGLRSKTTPFLKKYLFTQNNTKIALWSERPGIYGNVIKKIIRVVGLPIIHRYNYMKYKDKINVLLPLGTLGVETFSKYGWKGNSMFPFMYNPQNNSAITDDRLPENNNIIKFVYVGRFARSTKGIDILIKAFDKIENGGWHLDLVGGYGEYKEETVRWANKNKQISYLGSWPSDEIINRLRQYDVCIIPSRFDGWNVVANESILAGIGVIISNAAVSDELIKTSGAGIVFPKGDVNALSSAIEKAILNPELVELWKERAIEYAPRISSEKVGNYLLEVIEYTFINTEVNKPVPPWLD